MHSSDGCANPLLHLRTMKVICTMASTNTVCTQYYAILRMHHPKIWRSQLQEQKNQKKKWMGLRLEEGSRCIPEIIHLQEYIDEQMTMMMGTNKIHNNAGGDMVLMAETTIALMMTMKRGNWN